MASILDNKFDRLDEVPKLLEQTTETLQAEVMEEVERLMSQLETKDGKFVLSEKNISILESIEAQIKNKVFSPLYENALRKYAREFTNQAKLNDLYFEGIVNNYEVKPIYEEVVKQAQRNTIELLTGDTFTQPLMTPLKELMNTAVMNEGSYYDTLQGLRKIILGNDQVDGKLLSHVKRVAYDGFAISDRTYTSIVAKDLGLDFYRWSGGKIEDTRCFCLERAGKYYHRKEIEAWGDGKEVGNCGHPWQGMNSLTNKDNIFSLAGGYNCKHSPLPVSEKSVPESVIKRNKEKGNI
jgi:hypothetical protein